MSYTFVAARFSYPRTGPILALVIHMAEGGNTVHYLAGSPPRGNSSHFVIEYSGRIVQMVIESRASGSINPNDLRTDEGPAPFGISVAEATLGRWWRDPNAAVLAVELEGFAEEGPNLAQRRALRDLVTDLRRRYPKLGILGHRDFQNYKPCPGRLIAWDALGGHGPFSGATPPQEEPVLSYTADPATFRIGTLTVKPDRDHAYLDLETGALIAIDNIPVDWTNRPAYGPVHLEKAIPGGVAGANRSDGYVVFAKPGFVLASDVAFAGEPSSQDAVAAAVAHIAAPYAALGTAIKEAVVVR